jgi:transposase
LRGREPEDGGDGGDPGAEKEEDEFDDDGEEAQQRLQVRLEEYAATLSDKRRAAQAKSVERRLENKQDRGHHCLFLPKFHPELNFIERYWAIIKHWLRYH